MLAIMIVAAQPAQQMPPVPPSMTVIERASAADAEGPDIVISEIGTCLRRGPPIDLRRLWLLENREVALDTPAGPLTVTVERDTLRIAEAAADGKRRVRIWEIGRMFEDERGRLDVQLSLGVLDSDLVLYWRETYRNRIYRQGLFRIPAGELVALCEGRGGITRLH
ncbi:MAG TPA: hypothetical protein VF702_08220 [Allosphingosinicella sp.]|jgi:hypothetical protein